MTSDFVALLGDWSFGIFIIAMILAGNLSGIRKCSCPCCKKEARQ